MKTHSFYLALELAVVVISVQAVPVWPFNSSSSSKAAKAAASVYLVRPHSKADHDNRDRQAALEAAQQQVRSGDFTNEAVQLVASAAYKGDSYATRALLRGFNDHKPNPDTQGVANTLYHEFMQQPGHWLRQPSPDDPFAAARVTMLLAKGEHRNE